MLFKKNMVIDSFLQIHDLYPQIDIKEVASSAKGSNHSIVNTILITHLTRGVLVKP